MSSRIAFQTPWLSVEEIAPGTMNPHDTPFYRVVGCDGVVCLVLNESDEFVMVRQFRPAVQVETLEFPAGAIETGETPHQAAAREVEEEAGHACTAIAHLGAGCLHLDRFANRIHFFLGVGARPLADWPGEANLKRQLVRRSTLPHLIVAGGFDHTAGLVAIPMAEIALNCHLLNDPLAVIVSAVASATEATVHGADR